MVATIGGMNAVQRAELIRLIKALQPEASNRAIAKAIGVDESTVRADRQPAGNPAPASDDADPAVAKYPELAQADIPPVYRGARQWWLGDWWTAGVQWGEGEKVCEALGLEYGTAANCGRVARRLELSRRRDKLRFNHWCIRESCPRMWTISRAKFAFLPSHVARRMPPDVREHRRLP
jgi:hypothetical protein